MKGSEQPLYRNVEASRWHLGKRRRRLRCRTANMKMRGWEWLERGWRGRKLVRGGGLEGLGDLEGEYRWLLPLGGNEGGEGRRCGEMRVGCQGIGLRAAAGRPSAAMAAGGALGQSGRTTLAGTGETRWREGALLPAWPSPGAGGSRPPPCLSGVALSVARVRLVPCKKVLGEPRAPSERGPARCRPAAGPAVLPQGGCARRPPLRPWSC